MKTLHTFGCSITQGFALPDIVKTLVNENGEPLTDQEIIDQGIHWSDIHLYQPSKYAWPNVLANKLEMPVHNYARRGACFQQISRQCAVAAKDIKPDDIVIVMWTYLSRISIQWPARNSVPLCNIVDTNWGWSTAILGFNNLFGLSPSNKSKQTEDDRIQKYIENSTKNTYLDPMGVYDRYYNNLLLQQMTDGFLRATGARVLHLSVEPQRSLEQLELARNDLYDSLKDPYNIPHPEDWYNIKVDHRNCRILHDPSIPPAENDMHPSVTHHQNFADAIHKHYF